MIKKTLLIATVLLTACTSTTLDKALAQCALDQGKASYTRSEVIERFTCS